MGPSENLKIQQHEKLLSEIKKSRFVNVFLNMNIEQWPCVNIKLYLLITPVVGETVVDGEPNLIHLHYFHSKSCCEHQRRRQRSDEVELSAT